MFSFFAGGYAATLSDLRSAAHSLALSDKRLYSADEAWVGAKDALSQVRIFTKGLPLEKWLDENKKVERVEVWIAQGLTQPAATSLLELGADLGLEIVKYQALLIPPERRRDFMEPLNRFAKSVGKFDAAKESMAAASRCFALDEWEASIFHSMNVLEHGIRWLADQLAPMTFSKSIELASWGEILTSLRKIIDAENAKTPPPTPERSEKLRFYGQAATEFKYFQNAWRDWVMHERNLPYDEPEATRVLNHVAAFMEILAERA